MKTYLGDGVYVEQVGGMLRLTTENSISVTNTIYLEPKVYQALVVFVEFMKGAQNGSETG